MELEPDPFEPRLNTFIPPLAQWTILKEPGDPGDPGYNVIFPAEQSCNQYRGCWVGGCLGPGTAIDHGSVSELWSEMRERRARGLRVPRCVPDGAPRLKEK
jgi:hypothetical protein